ncbi:ATP-binding cassette domain-containing protein [Puia dinghuensis]|uniref:GTPase n=1 Tax=Puia dinghuensis TaxID=1792502 RepID=A0A8J2XS23_9BACT|nr:ATP-binding cassette domain-containing protein [Puia dinghuensis]GGA91838.1 GTPase [Puia dinghuensis]
MTQSTAFLDFQATKMLHTAQGRELLDISFRLDQGRILAIYGPSGAGKTTLLRILAGLTEAGSGHIRVGDDTWLDTTRHIHLPTRRRAIGFVFQDFALFPNLTVRQQLEYASPEKHDSSIIAELLALMELEALQHHRPALLSGGQQQRVALARAIARRPSLLLLDEPLSALDEEMRNKLQEYILKIQQRFHLTTILVSHYLPEILRLADTAIILKKGRIVSEGTPASLFAGQTPPQKNNSSFKTTGTILRIEPSANAFIVSVRCADTIIDLTLSAAEATALNLNQTVSVIFNAINPKIIP